jgi:hypothetical protein
MKNSSETSTAQLDQERSFVTLAMRRFPAYLELRERYLAISKVFLFFFFFCFFYSSSSFSSSLLLGH